LKIQNPKHIFYLLDHSIPNFSNYSIQSILDETHGGIFSLYFLLSIKVYEQNIEKHKVNPIQKRVIITNNCLIFLQSRN